MRYYYLHPFRVQYFFPKGFKKYELFRSFFKPFTTRGAVTWWLFNHVCLYRVLFGKNSIEDYIPEQKIRKLAGENAMMAFNTGTAGPGQKVTGIGILDKQEFFFKFAEKVHAKKLVQNEAEILEQLTSYKFVPNILDYSKSTLNVFLKTTVLKGERLAYESMDSRFMKRLFNISEINISSTIDETTDNSLVNSFAHGDFCPWNMMESNNGILIYDWEMAGIYPLGYDLFTFIFQTNFLNKAEKSVKEIMNENIHYMNEYFLKYGISNFQPYLKRFIEIKKEKERKKADSRILPKLKHLQNYISN